MRREPDRPDRGSQDRGLHVVNRVLTALSAASLVGLVAYPAWLAISGQEPPRVVLTVVLLTLGAGLALQHLVDRLARVLLAPSIRVDADVVAGIRAVLREYGAGVPLASAEDGAGFVLDQPAGGWLVVERVLFDDWRRVESEFNVGERFAVLPRRQFLIKGRRVSAVDMSTPLRRPEDAGSAPGEVWTGPVSLWQRLRWRRSAAKLGLLATTPAEVRELAGQLRRARPAPNDPPAADALS